MTTWHSFVLWKSAEVQRAPIYSVRDGSINAFDTVKTSGENKIKFLLSFLYQNEILNVSISVETKLINSPREIIFWLWSRVENAFLCANQTWKSENKRIVGFNM